MSTRRINLRYAGKCAVCSTALPVGAVATWDSDRRTATCPQCLEWYKPVTSGAAGGSAKLKGERLQRHMVSEPGLAVARPVRGTSDPVGGRGASWTKGAVGEQKLGSVLDETSRMSNSRILVLHDRRIPRSNANIDHIVVAPAGVWVIDAKRWQGRVSCYRTKGSRPPHSRLRVGRRDGTEAVEGVYRQLTHVAKVLENPPFEGVTLRGAICFVDAEWARPATPFVVDGVLIAWDAVLQNQLVASGPITPMVARVLHHHLARSFPPAA